MSSGVRRLEAPETYYAHDDGIVTYHTITAIPCLFSTQSSSSDDGTTVQDVLFRNGHGFQLRHRFDSLQSPHQQIDHVANTDGSHSLHYIKVMHATAPGSRTIDLPFAEVIGGDIYAGEYNRYLVERSTYKYRITSYEPFPITVGCTIGATACTDDKDSDFATHLAEGSLKFGQSMGMATSRYLFETTDLADDADGISASTEIKDLSEHLTRLPNTSHIIIPGAPVVGDAHGDASIYGAQTNGMTTMKGITRTLTVSVDCRKVLNHVATNGLSDGTGMDFSVDNHGGVVESTAFTTKAAVAPNPSSDSHFRMPGPGEEGAEGTNKCPGGIFGTVWVVPRDPMRRLDPFNNDDSTSLQLSSLKIHVEVESWHTVRLYDRQLNLPINFVPDAYVGLGAMHHVAAPETE